MSAALNAARYADVTSTLFSLVLASEQFLFTLYHYNSYANNPVMLRSPKPMVMRDVFLTKSNSMIPNPLSCLYVTTLSDCLVNCAASYLLVKPICAVLGVRHSIALYVGSGFFSSFAYLFSCQMNKSKTNSDYDCTCTSNGAYCGFAAVSLGMRQCCIPFSKRSPVAVVGAAYVAKCAYDEYLSPRLVERRRPGDIELRNWGFVGGVFFGFMYGSLFLRTRTDFRLMRTFYRNITRGPAAAAVNSPVA